MASSCINLVVCYKFATQKGFGRRGGEGEGMRDWQSWKSASKILTFPIENSVLIKATKIGLTSANINNESTGQLARECCCQRFRLRQLEVPLCPAPSFFSNSTRMSFALSSLNSALRKVFHSLHAALNSCNSCSSSSCATCNNFATQLLSSKLKAKWQLHRRWGECGKG